MHHRVKSIQQAALVEAEAVAVLVRWQRALTSPVCATSSSHAAAFSSARRAWRLWRMPALSSLAWEALVRQNRCREQRADVVSHEP